VRPATHPTHHLKVLAAARRDMGLNMAFYDLPNGGFIELVAPTGPDSVLRPALDKSGPGMNLMCFQCDDLAATVEMMKGNGVRVIEDDPTHIMVHPKSTHGILLQLVEKEPDAPKATKAGQVPDTSGVVGIVSYKCTVVFVKDIETAINSYKALGLDLCAPQTLCAPAPNSIRQLTRCARGLCTGRSTSRTRRLASCRRASS